MTILVPSTTLTRRRKFFLAREISVGWERHKYLAQKNAAVVSDAAAGPMQILTFLTQSESRFCC